MMIMNIPNYANEYNFIVATEDDGMYWFYGAYCDYTEATRVANEVNGLVFDNK